MYETLTPKALCETLETDENNGLKDAEASHRLQRDGENILRKTKDRTIWDMIQEQINDPMIFILFLAASISLLLREFSDTGIILAVIVLNTAIGGDSGRPGEECTGNIENHDCPYSYCKTRWDLQKYSGIPGSKR